MNITVKPTSEVRLVIDKAKLLNIGGGSISGFCRQYNIDRQLMSILLRGRSHVKGGTKTAKIVSALMDMGAARWENVEKVKGVRDVE